MKNNDLWKKKVLSNEFVSESSCFIIDDGELSIVAGEWLWKLNGEKKRIRDIKDTWLPPWPYKDRFDKHATLREGGGKPQYKADTYDFVADITGNGFQDIITVGMHKDPICWYENPGHTAKEWKKHFITEGGVYESVLFVDLFNDGKKQIITIPQKPEIAWMEPEDDVSAPWKVRSIGAIDGDWHGLGAGDVDNDGRIEIITKNSIYSQNVNKNDTWDRKEIISHDENGTTIKGLGDVFLIDLVWWEKISSYPVLFSTSPHGFGFFYWTLEKIKLNQYIYKKHTICDNVSQLHNVKVINFNGNIYVLTGKRYRAHGKDGDVDVEGKAYLLCFCIESNGMSYLTCVDDDSGAGIMFDAVVYNGKMYVVTSNKKGLFLFEKE